MYIRDDCNASTRISTPLGTSFENNTGIDAMTLLDGGQNFTAHEIEVFALVESVQLPHLKLAASSYIRRAVLFVRVGVTISSLLSSSAIFLESFEGILLIASRRHNVRHFGRNFLPN
jgi:hypothetical protein